MKIAHFSFGGHEEYAPSLVTLESVMVGVVVPLYVLGVMWLRVQGAATQGGNQGTQSPLKVAHCRANCIYKFSDDGGGMTCLRAANCQSCWQQCERLGAGRTSTCDQPTLCDAGCVQACHFHSQLEVQRSPVLVTRGQEVILVSDRVASWPQPSYNTPHVFVLMCRLPDHSWSQVTQTLALEWQLPESASCGAVRVMVVGPAGLITVYSPAPGPLQAAGLILRSVGKDLWNSQDSPSKDNASLKDYRQTGWMLREVSLIHQGVLVIAEVSWETQTSLPTGYLVTWELAGGGLKGNLFTETTSVTLSLWPDTVYYIQVQVVREPRRVSEPLELDTRQAAPLVPHGGAAPAGRFGHPGFEGVAGVAAAVLVFLAAALAVSAARRTADSKTNSSVDDLHASDHFKLFPPPVTLLMKPLTLPLYSSNRTATAEESVDSTAPHLIV